MIEVIRKTEMIQMKKMDRKCRHEKHETKYRNRKIELTRKTEITQVKEMDRNEKKYRTDRNVQNEMKNGEANDLTIYRNRNHAHERNRQNKQKYLIRMREMKDHLKKIEITWRMRRSMNEMTEKQKLNKGTRNRNDWIEQKGRNDWNEKNRLKR